MALVKFGGGVTQMAGSIGGTTFARNRSGNYARAKTKPVNPSSARQNVIRAAIAFLTQRWNQDVTAVQRTAWAAYGSAVTMKNRLGEDINLSGFNHYIRSNSILKQQAITLIDAGPTTLALPEQDPTLAITASAATQLVSVGFDDTLDWLDEDGAYLFVFCGTPQLATRDFFAGPWRFMDKIDGDSVTPPTTPTTMTAPFTLTEDQKIWVYARIARDDGRLSEPFRADVVVAA